MSFRQNVKLVGVTADVLEGTPLSRRHLFTLSSLLALLIGLAFSTTVFASAFDRIPPTIQYQEAIYSYYQRNYDTDVAACSSVALQRNTWVAAHPSAPPFLQILWLNPRPLLDPLYGLGCVFDYKHLVDELPSYHAGDVETGFQQGAIQTVPTCPTGYSLAYYYETPPFYTCNVNFQPQYWAECDCTTAGKPVLVHTGLEAYSEVDYPASGGVLSFTRYYRSSPPTTAFFQVAVGRLGYGWIDTYQRSIRRDIGNSVMPTVVTATRPTGHAVLFSLSGGVWTPNPDVSDRLIELVDGSGNT